MLHSQKSIRASALVTALMAISVISILTYSLLTWTNQERRQSKVAEARVTINYNAGALLEYGLAQMGERLKNASTLDRDEFRVRPLALPSSSFFSDNIATSSIQTELIAAPILDPISRYIDPLLQVNQNDPDKGKTIPQRDILLLSKVEQAGPSGSTLKDCNCAYLQIREIPVLSYGVFTHGDLIVLRPAQPMVISGPTHANGNLVMVSEGGVYFNGTVTAAGSLQALAPYGDVFFRTGGTDASPTYDAFNSYSGSSWESYALSRWNGYVQTQEMGIGLIQPFGVPANTTSAASNPYHKIIEPPTPVSQNPNPSIETEKFANKAGLVIKISLTKQSATDLNKTVTVPYPYLTRFGGNYTGVFVYNVWGDYEAPPLPAKSVYIATPPSQFSPPPQRDITPEVAAFFYQRSVQRDKNTVTVTAYKCTSDASGPYYRKNADGTLGRYRQELMSIPNLFNAAYPADPNAILRSQGPNAMASVNLLNLLNFAQGYYRDYNPLSEGMYYGTDVNEGRQVIVRSYVDKAIYYAGIVADSPYILNDHPCAPFLAFQPDPNTTNNAAIKLWDSRCRQWIHVVDLDVAKLKAALDAGSIPNWNGVVYVEFDDLVSTGLRLINGQALPSRGSEGCTIATNNRLYIKGHYNADGSMGTGQGTSAEANEVPAAVAADAVTVLSNYWDDRLSRADVTRFAAIPNQNDRNIPQDTEIAAAIITGTDVYNSGGINNLVRFLEMWENKVVRIRGSLIALFKSEVAWEPLMMQYVFYPPDREFSYSTLFKAGRFPPGTPTVRAFYKKKKQNISFEQYQALKNAVNSAYTTPSTTASSFSSTLESIQSQYR